jgi:hypothetical protein
LLEPFPQPLDVATTAGVELAAKPDVEAAPADDVGHEGIAGREPAAGKCNRKGP